MPKYLAAVVAVALALVGWGAQAQEVECRGGFPIFEDLAVSEQENEDRIACVRERKRVVQDSIAERQQKKSEITERIQQLRQRKQELTERINNEKERIRPLDEVLALLTYVRGDVLWLWETAACESGHDPDAHSSTGKYHGAFQFGLNWKDSLDWFIRYGSDDPHSEAFIVQAAAAAELKREGGAQHWPVCGQ